jgi:hypothetical protein
VSAMARAELGRTRRPGEGWAGDRDRSRKSERQCEDVENEKGEGEDADRSGALTAREYGPGDWRHVGPANSVVKDGDVCCWNTTCVLDFAHHY